MTVKKIRIVYVMGDLPEHWHRRLLRGAIHSRDPNKLKNLANKGLNINLSISDVFQDTPLTYAVKCGYLEVVEALVSLPECNIDQCNRNKHSALDEAICVWMVGASTSGEAKQNLGKRYRILRCLLGAGANRVTVTFLDMLVFSATSTKNGNFLLGKLTKVICEKGSEQVKNYLLGVLIPYRHTYPFIWNLLKHQANPNAYLLKAPARPFMPLDNAILLIKATNHAQMLSRIDCDTSGQIESTNRDWVKYKVVLRLLTLSGYMIPAHVMNHLYRNHADIYAWIAKYTRQPRKLSHLSRVVVRQNFKPSVLTAISKTKTIPETLIPYLIFEKVL